MKFDFSTPISKPEDYVITRWVSGEGRWWLEACQVLFGIRVRIRVKDEDGYCCDYCCGKDLLRVVQMSQDVAEILKHFPEDSSPGAVSRVLPPQNVKPIWNDPECDQRIKELAQVPPHPEEISLIL
jgi:hypothetical protein